MPFESNSFFPSSNTDISFSELFEDIRRDIVGTSWKKYPTQKPDTKLLPYEYCLFYDYMKKKEHPNITFIGKLYSLMEYRKKRMHWYEQLFTITNNILAEIHTDKPINNWLSAVDTLLQDPEYAQTFAYIDNLVRSKKYSTILNDPDSTTQSELNKTLTMHYTRLVELYTALKTVNDQQTKNRKQDVVDDIVKLGNSWI